MIKLEVTISELFGEPLIMADTETDTLFIKHLPKELSDEEKEELLRLVGATCVRCMSKRGHLKHTAFATFPNPDVAKKAMTRLHQLELLGRRLVVAFSSKDYSQQHPSVIDDKSLNKDQSAQLKDSASKQSNTAPDRAKIARKLENLGPKWGFEYPLDPSLEYMYPAPTVSILTNIANALASVPRFYVQVLHLMNKMNLPAPFGLLTPTPPLPEEDPMPPLPPTEPVLPPQPREVSTTDESEIESENESENLKQVPQLATKRAAKDPNRPRKRHRMQKVVAATPKLTQNQAPKPDDVFEQPGPAAPRKLGFAVNLSNLIADTLQQQQSAVALQVASVSSSDPQSKQTSTMLPPGDLVHVLPPGEQQQQLVNPLSVVEKQPMVEEGGFGKIEPVSREGDEDEDEDMEEEEAWGAGKFISSRRLRKGRISSSQMRDFSVFRSYQSGEATSRLYIKNLSKQVSEKDLHYIFGRYVDWEKEEEKIMFDIRLMTEGRMKGQAFVTLPAEKVAKEAVHDTNGFLLEGKPMVVQFARSAKPKEKETGKKDDKKKA